MSRVDPTTDISRRAFLTGACAAAVLAVGAVPAAADTVVRRTADGRLAVRVGRVPELAAVGGAVRVGTVDGVPVAVARTSSGYRAMSLSCPHQGATVIREASGWTCPAHGSEFTAAGGLELGPATRGLAEVPSRLRRGVLIVG